MWDGLYFKVLTLAAVCLNASSFEFLIPRPILIISPECGRGIGTLLSTLAQFMKRSAIVNLSRI